MLEKIFSQKQVMRKNFFIFLFGWLVGCGLVFDMNLNIGFSGSRRYPSSSMGDVRDLVRRLPSNCCVVTGGALGIDLVATRAAVECGLPVVWHLATRMPSGTRLDEGYLPAPSRRFLRDHPDAIRVVVHECTLPERNRFIVEGCRGVHLFFASAALGGGTGHTLRFCRKLGVRFRVHLPGSVSSSLSSGSTDRDSL